MFSSTNEKLKITLVSVPFTGHFKILSKLALDFAMNYPHCEITFVITGWQDITLSRDETNQLTTAGIKVIPFKSAGNIPSSAPMDFTFSRATELTESVIKSCEKSDYIIYDFFSPEGYIAGKKLNIPTICSVPAIIGPFDANNHLFISGLSNNQQYLQALEKQFDIELTKNLEMLSDGFFLPSNFKNIVWTWPGLMQTTKGEEPSFTQNRAYTENYIYMRPNEEKIQDRSHIIQMAADWKQQGKKVIYLSFGTVVTKNLWDHEPSVKAFVNTIFQIMLDTYGNHPECEIIVSTGRPISELSVFDSFPKNFHLYESVPQAELLKNIDLFITHAGGNSINDAIDANTPLLAIPFFGDQHLSAALLARKNIGMAFLHEEKDKDLAINTQSKLFFRKSLNKQSYIHAIETMLHSDEFKKNITLLKSKQPTTIEQLYRSFLNSKTLDWHEGDLLYGCTPDRFKLAQLTLQQNFFRICDYRPFTTLFSNNRSNQILPRIIDQYHDVLCDRALFAEEVKTSHSEIYRKILVEYDAFLRSHPHYLQPIGHFDQIKSNKSHDHLETLWNMCLGGLEFFTLHKHKTIHFVIGMFNDRYSEAAIRELEWIKAHWDNPLIQKYIKFYEIHNGLIKKVDPVAKHWFTQARPTPTLLDIAPDKVSTNQKQWYTFLNELRQKAQVINPHDFNKESKSTHPNTGYR